MNFDWMLGPKEEEPSEPPAVAELPEPRECYVCGRTCKTGRRWPVGADIVPMHASCQNALK